MGAALPKDSQTRTLWGKACEQARSRQGSASGWGSESDSA